MWSHASILLLLHSYRKFVQEFNNPKSVKSLLWGKLTKEFNKHGYNASSDQCRKKIQALQNQYKNCVDHNGKSGNNRKDFEFKEVIYIYGAHIRTLTYTCKL